MPMTALLMVVSLSWFLATWLQDRKAAMNEKERESNMEGAAVRERDQRERTTAEDNVAAEILRERRSRVETMTPAGEEDDIRPEHAPNVSTVPAVPTEDTTANILAKPLRRSSFMAVRERQALFDGVDPTILSNAMAT